ncbi:MAG: Shedu anti-phage system protein SduA domain-containing protein [Nitrospirota bacterium]
MPEIKHRQTNPRPEIEYAEIYIPDDRYFGTGSFKTVVKSGALSGEKSISNIMINPPIFQISVNLNPATREIHILLGHADGSDPLSRKLYVFPKDVSVPETNEFEVTFENWEITGLYMDKVSLMEIEELEMEGLLLPGAPLPEHLGTLVLMVPRFNFPQEVKNKILDCIFDLSKDFVCYQVEQGNTKIKIYRNTSFQFVYYHYNPTWGERTLTINLADVKRQGTKGFYLAASWSASKNSFYVGVYHPDPKFAGIREAFILTKDSLRLIKETIQEFERILNVSEKEEEVHQFLKNNSVLLGLTSIIEPISKYKLGNDYVIDFVIKEIPEGYVLIEIEKPGMRLFKKTNPLERTQELNHAIEQIENWKAWVGRQHSYISRKLEGISPNPVCWLIAGRKINLSDEQKSKLKEINETYKGVYKIFTYEDVVDRVNAVINKIA